MTFLSRRFWPAWLALCAGILVTSLATLYIKQSIEQDAQRYFSFVCDEITDHLKDRLASDSLVLQGAAALFSKSNKVSPADWEGYSEALRTSQVIRGAQGIGFAQRITPGELVAHTASIRAAGQPGYTVRPAGARTLYAPIVYTSPPTERNRRAIGFDMLSDPVRRAAMERARDRGQAALSRRTGLLAEGNESDHVGALMYVPIYRNVLPTTTIEQRRAALIGWAYRVYRMTEFVPEVINIWRVQNGNFLNLRIYDGLRATADTLMYESENAGRINSMSLFFQHRVVSFNDQEWIVTYDRDPGEPGVSYTPAWRFMAGGIALSALVFALLLLLVSTRTRAARIADSLTSEIREAAVSLQASEQRWKFAVEGSGDGLWDRDMTTGAVFRSGRWQELFGQTDGDIGSNIDAWERRIHPDDLPGVRAALQAHLDGLTPVYQSEHRIRLQDGNYRWIFGRGKVMSRDASGRPLRMIGTASDITARKQGEDALRMARLTLDSVSDALMWVDADARIVEVNAAACDMLGYTRKEMLKLHVWDINPASYIDRDAWPNRFAELARLGTRKFETIHRSKDGRMIPVEVVTSRIEFSTGSQNCAFIRDISARKQNEAALVAAAADAEKANNAKSRFLAAASHDLRQPLSALALYVGALHSIAPASCRDVVEHIIACSRSLNELLGDLLDVSKLDAGVVTPTSADFAVDDLLASLVSVNAAEADIKGLHIRRRDCGLFAYTDRQLYQRILGNLLSNAIRYTEKGGVLIACRMRGGKHWIEVWDTGIGISEKDTAIVFEEFRQVGDSARNRGSGLGLAIVAKSAALLGLQVRLRSRPGRGSLFAIEMPASANPGAERPPESTLPTRSCIIGLVEDNTPLRHALALALETLGHVVFPATGGAELLANLGEQAPDLIISDYRLAQSETGFDVIAAARAAFGEGLPAIIITGDTDPELIRQMNNADVTVQYKPLQIDELALCILQATNISD